MKEKVVLEVKSVSKTYGKGKTAVYAVRNVSFTAKKGEIVGIMGPSGSGKTTLLSIIGCLLKPTGGKVILNGHDVTALSENKLSSIRRDNIGFIFQGFNLLSALTALENVEVAYNLSNVFGKPARVHSLENLEMLGLKGRARFCPSKLSGGEKQRVAIARAIANEPDIILADEPTGSLDSTNGQVVMRLLRKLVKEKNKSAVIVTHDNRIVKYMDRILHLEDGKLRKSRKRS